MRVALVQHDVCWEDGAATRAHVAPLVAQAAGAGADLVLLPELFATGFSMATDLVAEPEGGPTSDWLSKQAAHHRVWVGGSVAERRPGDERPGNVFVLVAPDGSQHRYRKLHPFRYGGEHEKYEAGDRTLTVEVAGVRVTPFVCYDLRFADVAWAEASTTDCYVYVASWPAARRAHWRALLVARAIENQAYVAGVNRIGDSGGIAHAGDSCIVDPLGQVLVAAAQVEIVLVADVDPATVAATRERFPFLPDRRNP